jgi:HEAT repeat protein
MRTWTMAVFAALLIYSSASFSQSPNRVQMLIGNLSDPDSGIRTQAATSLAELGTNAVPAVPALIGVLDDKEPNVRYKAVIAIGKAGSSSVAIKALIREINDTSKDIRYEAVSALGNIGDAAGIAAEPLLKCLDSPDQALIENAGIALQKIKPPAALAMPTVMRLLRDGNYTQKVAALDIADGVDSGPSALDDEKTGPRTFNVLVQLLNDKSPIIREKALVALQSISLPDNATRQQISTISSALRDPEEDIRLAAVKVFAHSSKDNLRLIPLPLISDPYAAVRLAVIEVVGEDMRSVPDILTAFDDSSSEVRAAAIARLNSATIGRDEICMAASHATKDRFVSVRAAAATSLGKCSDTKSEDALAAVSSDPLAEVRIAALTSIARVQNHGWQSQNSHNLADSPLFGVVLHALDDQEGDVRVTAAKTLQSIVPLPDSYLESIAAHLNDNSKEVRAVVARVVGTYGSDAIKFAPQLRELLQGEGDDVQVAAAESLGLLQASDKATIDRFAKALDGFHVDDDTFRETILLSLGRIGFPSKTAVDAVVGTIADVPGMYDIVAAGMRSLREMGPDAKTALAQLYAKTPAARPANEPINIGNMGNIYRPTVQELIDDYEAEIKSSPVHVKAPDGSEAELAAGGRNLVIAIGTWCPHSRRLIDFLSNPRVQRLTSGWTFNFVLFDEKPEINALGGTAEPEEDSVASGFDKKDYPSPVPLYDVSILARLPGKYYFYSPDPKERIGLPSVFDPAKEKFHGSSSTLITRELGIPSWIAGTLQY